VWLDIHADYTHIPSQLELPRYIKWLIFYFPLRMYRCVKISCYSAGSTSPSFEFGILSSCRLGCRHVIESFTVSTFSFEGQLCTLHECSPFRVGIFIHRDNYHVYCFIKTCAFWLTKHWRISIYYKKVKYYV